MYTNTILTCYVVIQNEGRYLLVEKKHPLGGNPSWNFLRNEIHVGESLVKTATRIAKEDIGVEIQLTGIVKVLYHSSLSRRAEKSGGISLAFAFYATATNRPAKFSLGRDVLATKWITKEELASTKFGGPQGTYIARQVAAGENYPLSLFGPDKME